MLKSLLSHQPTLRIPPNGMGYHAIAVGHDQDRPQVLDSEHCQVVHHLQAAVHPPGVFVALRILVSWWNLILDKEDIRKRDYAAKYPGGGD